MHKRELFVVILIVAIAAGMRLYHLDVTPPGLAIDESINGVNALQALHTKQFRLSYPITNDVAGEGLFVNLQAVSVHFFDTHAWSLRLVAAIAGIFTVLGTYLLAKRLFANWELAAIAAFLMAVGSWHVTFSRMGLSAIMAPLCAVWALYYLWTALLTHRLWHWLAAGIFLAVGFHSDATFRVMPAVVALVIAFYLWALRHDFRHDKYVYTRHQLWGGMALMTGVLAIAMIPLLPFFSANPPTFIALTGQPWDHLGLNFLKSVGMFMFQGDTSWQHGIAGLPLLFWPVAALFAVGLVRTFLKLGRSIRTHGHPSVVQVLLASWFLIGLVPAILATTDTPNALQALLVAPVVYILAAEGLWWLYSWMLHWYQQGGDHKICLPGPHGHRYCAEQSTIVVTIALVSFLFAIGVADANRYFVEWAGNPEVSTAFNTQYTSVAERLASMPPATLKYVVYQDPRTINPIMFLTNTATPADQKLHNIYYLSHKEFVRHQYAKNGFIVQLNP